MIFCPTLRWFRCKATRPSSRDLKATPALQRCCRVQPARWLLRPGRAPQHLRHRVQGAMCACAARPMFVNVLLPLVYIQHQEFTKLIRLSSCPLGHCRYFHAKSIPDSSKFPSKQDKSTAPTTASRGNVQVDILFVAARRQCARNSHLRQLLRAKLVQRDGPLGRKL